MKILETITSKGELYTANIILDDFPEVSENKDSVFFVGDMDNDVDGTPFWSHDPTGQANTALRYDGRSIDGSVVPGIVLPPECIKVVAGIVLGCLARVYFNGKTADAVVFDIGPHNKLGEGSPALMELLDIPWQHNGNGGVDEQLVTYRYWPGIPALIEGISYSLQHYGP